MSDLEDELLRTGIRNSSACLTVVLNDLNAPHAGADLMLALGVDLSRATRGELELAATAAGLCGAISSLVCVVELTLAPGLPDEERRRLRSRLAQDLGRATARYLDLGEGP